MRDILAIAGATMIALQSLGAQSGAPPISRAAVDTQQLDFRGPPSLEVNGKTIQRFYTGQFYSLEYEISPKGVYFHSIFRAFVEACGIACPPVPPTMRAQLTVKQCTQEEVQVTRLGIEVGPRYCAGSWQRPTGIFVDSALFKALASINFPFFPVKIGSNAVMIGDDGYREAFRTLFQRYGCNSPQMTRLRANVVRYALNQPPLTFSGTAVAEEVTPSLPVDADFVRLLNDLISDREAFFSSSPVGFVPGSVASAKVDERDGRGYPRVVSAQYLKRGLGGAYVAAVTLFLERGLPSCLKLEGRMDHCASQSRKEAYKAGEYTPRPRQ